MASIFKLPVTLLCIMLLLTGCWNIKEVNDLVIAVAMGVDKAEEGYVVSVQVVDPGEVASKKGDGRVPVTVYKETGQTIFEAIRRMSTVSARKIYFSHLRMFIIGEETAKTEGVAKLIEFIYRDHEFRHDYYLAIARKTKAEQILTGLTPIEKISANKMYTSLEQTSQFWAATSAIKMDELISELMTEGKALVMPGIRYIGDVSKGATKDNVEVAYPYAQLKYGETAVFREDKLIGWLGEEEGKGYNYLTGHMKSTVESIACPEEDGKITIELYRSSSRIQVKWNKQSPHLSIYIDSEGGVGEAQCEIRLKDPKVLNELKIQVEEKIETSIRKTLEKAVLLKTDIVGLGAAIHRSNAKAWKSLSEEWQETMASVPVTVKVNLHLKVTGAVTESFLDKVKE